MAVMILMSSISASAKEASASLHKIYISDDVPVIEPEPEGQRKPSAPILCTIDSDSGVHLMNISNDEIVLYVIYTVDTEECVFMSNSESDFTNVLFSLRGEFRIIFRFNDYALSGFVEI